jgi:hypothetical protein
MNEEYGAAAERLNFLDGQNMSLKSQIADYEHMVQQSSSEIQVLRQELAGKDQVSCGQGRASLAYCSDGRCS